MALPNYNSNEEELLLNSSGFKPVVTPSSRPSNVPGGVYNIGSAGMAINKFANSAVSRMEGVAKDMIMSDLDDAETVLRFNPIINHVYKTNGGNAENDPYHRSLVDNLKSAGNTAINGLALIPGGLAIKGATTTVKAGKAGIKAAKSGKDLMHAKKVEKAALQAERTKPAHKQLYHEFQAEAMKKGEAKFVKGGKGWMIKTDKKNPFWESSSPFTKNAITNRSKLAVQHSKDVKDFQMAASKIKGAWSKAGAAGVPYSWIQYTKRKK